MNTAISMLTRDKKDLIVGIDYDNAEVWLYSGIVVSSINEAEEFWFIQGQILSAMV